MQIGDESRKKASVNPAILVNFNNYGKCSLEHTHAISSIIQAIKQAIRVVAYEVAWMIFS